MKKKLIFRGILIALILVVALFLYSENVSKIEIVDNIKNTLVEQIQNTIDALSGNEEPTIIDVTGLVKGKETEHEHLYKTMYDETKHWEECTVCGQKNEESKHVLKRTWVAGNESCEKSNYYTDTCSCGYSYIDHKPCVWDGKTYGDPNVYYHSKTCSICKGQIYYKYYLNSYGNGTLYTVDSKTGYGCGEVLSDGRYPVECCYKSDGTIINCNNLGKCVVCSKNVTSKYHKLQNDSNGKLYCIWCGNEYGSFTQNMTIDSNIPTTYTTVTNYTYTNGATFVSTAGMRNVGSPFQNITSNVISGKVGETKVTIKDVAKFKSTWKINYSSYLYSTCKINGVNCQVLVTFDELLSPDIISPIISNITMEDNEELTDWSRAKTIIIKGTENYCNTVKVKILDDDEKTVFEGETTVNNGQYSISCTPDIEADEIGRKFKAIVTDACENSTEQEFTIAKVDAISPEPTSGNEILGDWAQSKDFTFTATDKGIGNISIAFNDVKDYALATKIGETYSRNYRFIGDVYNPTEAVVFYKDELGNVSTQTVTLDKIDNTGPTVTSATVNKDKLSVQANDEHPELGEGSGVVKYKYFASNEKLENPTVTSEWKESNINEEGTIENISDSKYIYIVAEDAVGNIGEVYEYEVPLLVLNTSVNLSAANGKGGVDLDWSTYDATGKVFKAYQKKENSEEWESISTFDYYSTSVESIKVLNVYPETGLAYSGNIPITRFDYLEGISESLPKSAALKVWMEGGTMTESGKTTTFNAYGKNPITDEQIINVTSISSNNFNKNPEIVWNYDVIMIGTWDGIPVKEEPSDKSLDVLEKYIQAGYGIMVGHGLIEYAPSLPEIGKLRTLRKYFNIEIGYDLNYELAESQEMDIEACWRYYSSYIIGKKNGLILNFPYEIPLGTKLTIPVTHTLSDAAHGNVWFELIDGYEPEFEEGKLDNYYKAGGKGNPKSYLTTWNNTAMIQTGHSNCDSTDDERKILANTLFYLKQRTTATKFTDNSSQDLKAPNAPIINVEKENKNIKVSFNSDDNGSKYAFYVEAYDNEDSSKKLATSNQREETVTTGTKGYYYIIDENSENTDFDITADGVQYTTDESIIVDAINNGKYIHMKAEDVVGNISESSVSKLEIMVNVIVNLDGGKIEEKDYIELEGGLPGKNINLDELGKPEKEGYRFIEWKATNGTINENEYIYPVQDDVIIAIYEKIPDLILNTEVNLDAANKKGGVDLDWKFNLDDTIYKVYQRKDDEESAEWESISTFDFYSKNVEPIKVLNIYPESNSSYTIPTVTFKYLDGTSESLPKSASLKVWMEGGTMNGERFEAYGKNPITGEQIIKVMPVSNSEFNKNPDMVWNYDIVMFGTWDGNGGTNAQPSDDAMKVVEKYMQAGYGVLLGHDTIRQDRVFSDFRKYFNINIGKVDYSYANSTNIDFYTYWRYSSTYAIVNKNGLLTNFPYEIPIGTKLSIPLTHTVSQAALGNVWMTLVDGTDNFQGAGSIKNYYNAGGKGNPVYYLTTWNNTAMIQTGHSNGESTDDERKVLANTLFYLKQRTIAKSFTDNSSQDLKAPDTPIINAEKENQSIKVNFNSNDNGSTYSFYVEAYDSKNSSKKLATSNQRTETVTTGTKGYYYIINEDSENTDFDINADGVQYTTDNSILLDKINNGKYIHMKAEDVAGNISEPSVLKLDVRIVDLEEKITIEVTKKWVDNNIQALRRPNQIKFIVTQYKDMAEDSVLENEEVISNEDVSSVNDENNINNQTEENVVDKVQDEKKDITEENKDVEENIQNEINIDKENTSAKEVLNENKILENAYSNEILKSSILPDAIETITPNSIKVENEIVESMQEEQVENDNNETESIDSKLEEDLVQNENSTQQNNELEQVTTSTKPEEGSKIPDETTNNETVNSISEETSTTPEGEEVEILIYEYTMTVDKNQDSQVYTIELPKYDKETEEEIKYIITEEEVNEGDLKFYQATGGEVVQTTDEEGNVKYTSEIVNTFKLPENNTQNITATKVWNDNNNKKLVRPTSIVLELIGKVENISLVNEETVNSEELAIENNEEVVNTEGNTEIVYKDVVLKKQSLSSAGNWKHIFIGVPIYDENGQKIEYSVHEDITQETLDKYISDVSNINESNEITVTNSLIVQDSKIEKTGTEEINAVDSKVNYLIDYTYELDNRYAENARIEIVDTLPYEIDESKSDLNGGIYSYNEETKVATITWTGTYNSTDRTIIWDNELDGINVKVAEDKEKNVYTIDVNLEIGVIYKDIQIATEKITNKVSGKITLSNDVIDVVEDSFETGTRWVKDVVVNKLWKGDTAETRPDSITVELVSSNKNETTNSELSNDTEQVVELTNDEQQSPEPIETTATIIPTENEEGTTEWTHTWSELPTYDAEGNEIKYTVNETAINYTKGEQPVENEYYCEKKEEIVDGKTIVTLTNIKYGGITVEKVDSRKEELKLEGAEFKLEKMVQNEEGKWIVPEETSEDYLVYTGTTGVDGRYTFENLKYGYYKLTETQAPEDYKISEKDIDVIKVNEENADVQVQISNIRMYKLPITGGIGVDTIRNLEILVGIIVLILITNRKKVVPTRRSKAEARKIKNLEKLAKMHKINK